ncbi:flagellar hook protein FlgE [Vreelandella boliviensis]|uniref:Flagellar hook protein FlgE n=1 Tax=Vreelandella boliviensis LC1 TaxID=1072583 RepID=A0A265DYV2_9GAMM|nr:flagellar hook protein FlgE [Halomonas boliviensis]EHJ94170.1 Flagellar hook protein flgE [Halomonas boliviensis LC1]OZT74440.1 flagellar hook protein FlgE [Halomonas boliviensis LC1]
MSFSQALSGLNAQQQKLGAVGNNIANSQTVGFKSSNVQFADVYAESRIGLGVRTSAVQQNFGQGNIESTNRNLDLAIAGEGFFRFQQPNGEVGYSRNGQLTMTADGRLVNAQGAQIMGYAADANGNVQAGGQVAGLTVDSDALPARATTAVKNVLNLDSREQVGEDLDRVEVNGEEIDFHFSTNFTVYDSLGNPFNNTVYYEKVGSPDGTNQNVWEAKVVAGNEYNEENNFLVEFSENGTLVSVREINAQYLTAQDNLNTAQSDFNASQTALSGRIGQIREQFEAAKSYLDDLISSGDVDATTIEIIALQAEIDNLDDGNGNGVLVDAESAVSNGGQINNDLFTGLSALYAESANVAAADADFVDTDFNGDLPLLDDEVQNAAGTFADTYNTNRTNLNTAEVALVNEFNNLPAQDSQTEISLNINSGAASPLAYSYDLAGTTQFGNGSTATDSDQDGFTSGALVGITIEDDGTVMRNYSNEQSLAAGQIALVSFRNPEGLKPNGDNLWTATAASGQELVGAAGTGLRGLIEASAVETSNVDMARELVDMIVAQRAYQANSQTISTQDELLQTIINL